MTINQKYKKLFPYLLMLGVFLVLYLISTKVKSDDVVAVVRKAGILGSLLYILILASTQIFAPVSGTPVFLAGYVLFNSKVQFYAYLATMLSGIVNFWLARKWGRRLVSRMVSEKDIDKVDAFTKDYGVQSLILLRVFQGHLADFISYAYGLTNIKFLPYMVVTAIAPIPWLLLWQFVIFKRINGLTDFTAWFIVTLIPFLIISWLFWKYKYKKK